MILSSQRLVSLRLAGLSYISLRTCRTDERPLPHRQSELGHRERQRKGVRASSVHPNKPCVVKIAFYTFDKQYIFHTVYSAAIVFSQNPVCMQIGSDSVTCLGSWGSDIREKIISYVDMNIIQLDDYSKIGSDRNCFYQSFFSE